MDNKGFKEAFGSIYDKYYALCMMYIRRIEQEAALINQEGKNDVKIVGDEIFFKSEGSSLLSIVPILKNARPILEKELQSDSLSNLPIFIWHILCLIPVVSMLCKSWGLLVVLLVTWLLSVEEWHETIGIRMVNGLVTGLIDPKLAAYLAI